MCLEKRPRAAASMSIISAMVLFLLTSGCGGGGNDNDNGTRLTRARIVNALAGVPAPGTLNITAGDMLVARNLPPGGVTSYSVVSAGDRVVTAASTIGTGEGGSTLSPLVLDASTTSADLRPNLSQTIVVAGDVSTASATASASPGPATGPHVVVLTDDIPANLAEMKPSDTSLGRAAVRLVHVDTSAPQPLYLFVGRVRLIGADNIARDNSSPYLYVSAGEITLSIRDTGEPPPSEKDPETSAVKPYDPNTDSHVVRSITATLQGGRAYTVFIAPMSGATTNGQKLPPVLTLDQ